MLHNPLSLPLDIPWKKISVSEDMMDKSFCDRNFPHKWRSSIAVFSYEPPEEFQDFEGMTASYLKVVCTITGFQPDQEEVGLKNRKVNSNWNDPEIIETYRNVLEKYYGCHGALLQVTVSPAASC